MNSCYFRAGLITVALAALSVTQLEPASHTQQVCTLAPLPNTYHGQRAAPRIRNRNGTSGNWSGYAVETRLASPQKNAVSNVEGSWTIPTLSPSASSQAYSSFWVGIDGDSDNTVEQIGTEQDWTPNGQQNYVWFEMYPHVAYEIVGFPIAAGDKFGAGVRYMGSGTFVLSITNLTRSVAYTVPTRYTKMRQAQRSSAEWIAEAPYSGGVLPLADFGTAYFSGCVATLNGNLGPIDYSPYWQNEPITKQGTGGAIKAQPSALNDTNTRTTSNSAFSVRWFHE